MHMGNYMSATEHLYTPEAAARLAELYGKREGVQLYQIDRYRRVAKKHREYFGERDNFCFCSAPGRTEVCGNHTDHNAGRVLAAAVNLDTVAAVTPNNTGVVTLYSEGYQRPFVVDLKDLEVKDSERETTLALIRGVAARMKALGYKIGGFDAVATSTVFKGSGLSSSAAFEVMTCAILDGLYNGFTMDGKLRAQIAQYAENVYFGKPCGLMDQMASSLGGLVAIDFRKPDPKVEAIQYDFAQQGYALAVVSTEGDHGNLTGEYAAIPREMKQVAACFGGKVLRDVLPEQVEGGIAQLKGKVPDRAILRALHFYDENRRVSELVEALKRDELFRFFELIVASGESSWKLLQNIYVPGSDNQSLALALEVSRRMLEGRGAWRIHGGGFAGTILAFVPQAILGEYTQRMDAIFGAHACTVLDIRPCGASFLEI